MIFWVPLTVGDGAGPTAGVGSAGAALVVSSAWPFTSSSRVTPNTSLSFSSLSSSGTEVSVSHLEMDCRDTCKSFARSS